MRRLPLFVLPTVLYPGTIVPLHVFEPRYRRLMAYCLEGDGQFGFLYHDFDAEPAFTAREGRIGCVAQVAQFQPLPDGRSLVLAHGLERFRIMDGVETDSPYHEAVVEEYLDVAAAPDDIVERRTRTLDLFRRALGRVQPDGAELPHVDLDRDVSFLLAAAVQIDVRWRQMLLELPTEGARLYQLDMVLLPLGDAQS